MSCRKPQNVVCHKFCPHTKYLKACKYYFKNKSIASLRGRRRGKFENSALAQWGKFFTSTHTANI